MSLRLETLEVKDEAGRVAAADAAAAVLSEGGLVLHPTETVYGIGGDGSENSNRLIARIKRRELSQPLLLLVPDQAALRSGFSGLEWPEGAGALAARFWPGPLTLVLPCAGAPAGLCGPEGGLAVRVSPDPTVAAILARWRRPMTSSSANLSGEEPPQTLDEALAILADRDDLVDLDLRILALDAGPSLGTRGSTVVSFVSSPPRLVREGPVAWEEIAACLPNSSEAKDDAQA